MSDNHQPTHIIVDEMTEQRDRIRATARALNAKVEKPPTRSRWRHRRTGNEYRVESISEGSGHLHGHLIVHYRRTNTDILLFSRLLLEWHDKMERV